jgi:hypothetical protein
MKHLLFHIRTVLVCAFLLPSFASYAQDDPPYPPAPTGSECPPFTRMVCIEVVYDNDNPAHQWSACPTTFYLDIKQTPYMNSKCPMSVRQSMPLSVTLLPGQKGKICFMAPPLTAGDENVWYDYAIRVVPSNTGSVVATYPVDLGTAVPVTFSVGGCWGWLNWYSLDGYTFHFANW